MSPSTGDPTSFVQSVYQQLFNRTLSPRMPACSTRSVSSMARWAASAVGAMILNIISGATGTDNTTVINRVGVAVDFTSKATNAGATWSGSLAAASSTNIAATTDTAASVTAALAANTAAIAAAPGPQQNFTLGLDTFTSSAVNANFNAGLQFNPATGFSQQTLQAGDSAIDTAPMGATGNGGTFTAILNDVPAGTGVIPLVTLKGIPSHSVTSIAGAATGYRGDITDLVTFTNNGSTGVGALTIGAAGQGIDKGGLAGTTTTAATLLSTVNLNGVQPGAGATTIIVNTTALAGTSDALAINFTGAFGTKAAPMTVSVKNDTAAATVADNAYETLNVKADSTTWASLSDAGSGILSTTKINVAGAGNTFLGAGAAENYKLVTTIDASTQTGGVTITGLNSIAGTGFAAGLLAANTVLTSFKGGTGADSLDISSMTTVAQLGGFTAGNLDGGTGTPAIR